MAQQSAISASLVQRQFMPESEVVIPFRDRSWKYGDGAFDMTRTFDGRPSASRSISTVLPLAALSADDPGISPKEMIAQQRGGRGHNEHLRAEVGDWWSASASAAASMPWATKAGNIPARTSVIEMLPLPFAKRAKQYRDGAES